MEELCQRFPSIAQKIMNDIVMSECCSLRCQSNALCMTMINQNLPSPYDNGYESNVHLCPPHVTQLKMDRAQGDIKISTNGKGHENS